MRLRQYDRSKGWTGFTWHDAPILTAHYDERNNKVRYYYTKKDADGQTIRVYMD